MEIIAAGKKLSLILIYRAINWFIAYRDRPTSAAVFYTLTITARSAICGAHVVHGTHSLYKRTICEADLQHGMLLFLFLTERKLQVVSQLSVTAAAASVSRAV